jgi:hypothetical protein
MPQPTAPLHLRFPNREDALEEAMPVLCSILFGFSGAYFAAVAVADKLGDRTFADLPWIGKYLGGRLDFSIKPSVLLLSGICCVCFYLSTLGAIYAKMVNVEKIASSLPTGRTADQQVSDNTRIRDHRERRRRCLLLSLVAFNVGVFLLPMSVLVFLPSTLFVIGVAVLLAVAIRFVR